MIAKIWHPTSSTLVSGEIGLPGCARIACEGAVDISPLSVLPRNRPSGRAGLVKSYSYAWRVLSIATAVAVGTQSAGCASTTKENKYGLPENQVARIVPGFDWVAGKAGGLGPLSVDGIEDFHHVVLPGNRAVEISASWSNKFRDVTRLAVNAQPGRQYVVLIYEMEQGQDVSTVEIRPKTFGEQLLEEGVGCMGPGCGLMLIFALPFIIYQAANTPKPATSRPHEGCCFVWIQDLQTSQVVAGISPRPAPTQ